MSEPVAAIAFGLACAIIVLVFSAALLAKNDDAAKAEELAFRRRHGFRCDGCGRLVLLGEGAAYRGIRKFCRPCDEDDSSGVTGSAA